MKKSIQQQELLIYYDGVQLFLGKDQVGAHYLCVLEEYTEKGDLFLCAPISSERLFAFYRGELDLRDVFSSPETGELFTIEIEDLSKEQFELQPVQMDEISEEWLPEEGFFYLREPDIEHHQGTILADSQEKNRAIIYLSLNPPEARSEPKINTIRLAEALVIYQTLVKRAYYKVKTNMNRVREDIEEMLDVENQYKLDAYATSPGSFTIYLQSHSSSDLLGYVDIAKALERIDLVTKSLDDISRAVSVMKENKGHFANAYLRLLEFIVKNEAPISYQWTIPSFNAPVSLSISKNRAIQAYEVLTKVENLGVETVEIVGRLTKVDTKRRSWTLSSVEDNKIYSGFIKSDSNLTLRGVVMETEVYRFICEEFVEEVTGTGQEKTRLFLVYYEKA